MLSIIADALMTASRQDQRYRQERDPHYADRFVPEARRRADSQARRHNPYSYFQ
ncbi:MAG: hypothetical protein AAF340_02960 [Pseudomonadota bacterium]